MEMEMEMEEEMEVELVFEAREVDLDYEFDAAMFFDFTREESPAEARAAELWFETAQSYPPSPFVAKLVLREDSLLEDPKSKDKENTAKVLGDDYGDGLGSKVPSVEVNNEECNEMYGGVFTNLQSGCLQKVSNRLLELATAVNLSATCYNHTYGVKSKAKVKATTKSYLPRSSTLMKPTASMLAKQNRAPQTDVSRFQMLLAPKERSLCNPSVESQAAKRQKLEGGHSRKVVDAKQQTEFIHKEPKKDEIVDRSAAYSRLRLTIPREPDLETSHRAQRMRPKNSTEVEPVPILAQRFKARPLNRKILEAPSLPIPKKSTPKLPEFQEFHLKTLERAMQHSTAVSSSSIQHNNSEQGLGNPSIVSVAENGRSESRRPSTMDAQKEDSWSRTHVFKARPLNRKILTSKGDIGIFRNSKREITVPMEFSFHTEKRMQHDPPIELFNKLSLASELQANNGSQLQLRRPSSISIKGSKENRLNPLQTEHKMTHSAKEKPHVFGGKQTQRTDDIGNQLSLRRSLGVR